MHILYYYDEAILQHNVCVFNRKSGTTTKKSMPGGGSGGGAGMWKFYSEDSPGIKVYVSLWIIFSY